MRIFVKWVHDGNKNLSIYRMDLYEPCISWFVMIRHGTTCHHDAASSKILHLNRTATFLGLLHLCSHSLSASILIKVKRSTHVHVTCCKMNGEKGGFHAKTMLWPQFEHFSPQDISDVCFFHLHFRSSKVKEYHVFLPIWDLLFHSFQRMHKVSCVCELDLPHPSLLEEWNCVDV